VKRIIAALVVLAVTSTPVTARRYAVGPDLAPVAVVDVPTLFADGPRTVRPARAPRPAWAPPATGDLIEVSIAKQRLTLWHDGVIEMRLVISTGMKGYETPTGHYRIRAKVREGFSKKWGVVMPWAMQWNGNYMIHQLTHYPDSTQLIGRSDLGTPASHGCIRVDAGDAERLYHRTRLGTPVWVH
jgi:lipoprotein-anchoring transpeptidase ErfK/SrfK